MTGHRAFTVWLALVSGACFPAFVPACTPVAEAPVQDSGVCARHCSNRFAVGCLEPALAAHCEETCVKRVAQGYDAECAARATREGMRACNIRCAP